MAQVTIIPAKDRSDEIVRTAAYARVSSDSQDQLNSFAAQIRYYTEMLQNSNNAVFVDMYADDEHTQWYIFNSVIISRSYRQICNKRRAFEYTLRLHLRGREPRFCQSVYGA